MPTPPLRLSDSELDVVMQAATLDVASRDAFLQAVAARLAHHRGELGEGMVFRICAELLRQMLRAPIERRGRPRRKTA